MTIAVHVTHIHFLTLLFPSALEAKLIFVLLGELVSERASGGALTGLMQDHLHFFRLS